MSDEAIPAATLILVREPANSAAPEVLMVERSGGMAFAAGALVFPGGRIDDADRQLAVGTGADPAAIAAIRETIEETAVPAGLSPLPDAATARARPRAFAPHAGPSNSRYGSWRVVEFTGNSR